MLVIADYVIWKQPLNVVATGCVEAALPSFIANQILPPTLTPWRVGEAEEEVRGWS